jgi:hypothetical protein
MNTLKCGATDGVQEDKKAGRRNEPIEEEVMKNAKRYKSHRHHVLRSDP